MEVSQMIDATSDQTETAAAFNLGADARLAGRPLDDNPFSLSFGWGEHQAWKTGWRHVESEWGRLVKGRWYFRPLPQVN